jgi:hypothetical protein
MKHLNYIYLHNVGGGYDDLWPFNITILLSEKIPYVHLFSAIL